MTTARRIIFGLLLAAGLARMAAFLAYAASTLPSPLETFHLEAKMVLLAYRAEIGASLYPAWRDGPHVANFFGPAYFWGVGKLGAIGGAGFDGLFAIGRGVSFGSALLTSLVVGVVAQRRYGRVAGASAAILSLGSAAMFGFSVMVRPDLLAECLGVVGFFLAGRRGSAGRWLGGGLLALAILTKQTAGIFLLARALADLAEGDWRRGARLMAGTLGLTIAVVVVLTLSTEPLMARSLAGESKTPWEFASWSRTLTRAARTSPDLLVFPAIGLILWVSGATGRREPDLAVLAAVLLATSIGLAAKRGADLNYYLSLRVVEGLAVGALWRGWSVARSPSRSAGLAALVALGTAALVPGLLHAATEASVAKAKAAFLAGPYGRDVLGFYRDLDAKAAAPGSKILTDSGLIDLHHGRLADFGDPWLFRVLAQTGQVVPKVMRDRVDSRYYDLIVTTSELDRPGYDSYEFGLPMAVVERARARYERIGDRAGLFLYRPRPRAR